MDLQRLSRSILAITLIAISTMLLVIRPEIAPATTEEVTSTIGGHHCKKCTSRPVGCESVACFADDVIGAWSYFDGSGRDREPYCLTQQATGWLNCVDGYTQNDLRDCVSYWNCADQNCEIECVEVLWIGVSGGCVAAQACNHGT